MFDYNRRNKARTNSHPGEHVSKNAPRSKARILSVQSNSDAGRYTLIHRQGAQRALTAFACIVLAALLITGCGGGGKKSASAPGSNKGKTFAVLKSLPCDVFLGAHGAYYGMVERYALLKKGQANAFVNPEGYKEYVALKERAFRKTLAEQKGQAE